MGIMAGVWLPSRKHGSKEKTHPANFLFKTLLVFLFITTVGGSSMNTVMPLVDTYQAQKNQTKMIELLQRQEKDNALSFKVFSDQNQRLNTALSARNQAKTREELKQLIKDQQSFIALFIEIFIIVFLRFGVQLANLSCIWLVGWLYRENQPKAAKSRFKVKRLEKISVQPSIKKTKKLINNAPVKTNEVKAKVPSPKAVANPEKVIKSRKKSQTDSSLSPKTKVSHEGNKKPVVTESKPGVGRNLEQIRLKRKISSLLRSRNEGVSLSQIGKAIGENENSLRKIVDFRDPHETNNVAHLESVLNKIQRLYQEENARSFSY